MIHCDLDPLVLVLHETRILTIVVGINHGMVLKITSDAREVNLDQNVERLENI